VAPREWRLSEEGQLRSVVLADRLRSCSPGVFAASEEPKAAETAEIAARCLGVESLTLPGLHEHDRSRAPFLGNEEVRQAARNLFENPEALVWGRVNAEAAGSRFEGAVRGVLDEREEEEEVVVVAHGTVISVLVARHNGVDVSGSGGGWASPPSACSRSRASRC